MMFKKKNYGSLIDGLWVTNTNLIDVINPFNQEIIGTVSDLGADGAVRAILAAQEAFKSWSAETAEKRSDILFNWFDLVKKNNDQIAEIITLESGKPLKESYAEVDYAASFIKWFGEQAKRVDGSVLSSPDKRKKMLILKQPIGVVSAITPWNFPIAMAARKASAAIAAGCTVVLKPSELTPFTALKLAELSIEAGLPSGVLNIVNGMPKPIGEVFSTHELVKKVTFTGSTKIGKYLMNNASSSVKSVSLELGGNAPFIIFEDADLDQAVTGLISCKFRNAGQTCISANRIFVHKTVSSLFLEKLNKKMNSLKVGDGMLNNDIGPLISETAVRKVENNLLDASKKGANIISGGKRHSAGKFFFEPTLITNVNHKMKVFTDENFGPIIPLISFSDDEEVIRLANNTNYGLAAYFYTKKIERIWEMSERLDYGMFGINTGKISTYLNPFGGVKESGIGREGSSTGLEPFLEKKFISWEI